MPLRAGWLHHRARFWAMSKDHLEDNVKAAAFLLPRLGPWLEDHMHVPTHTRKHSLSLSLTRSRSRSLILALFTAQRGQYSLQDRMLVPLASLIPGHFRC